MSAPKTNIERQARRHRGPLIGMTLAVIIGVSVIFYWVFEEAAVSDPPPNPEVSQEKTPAG